MKNAIVTGASGNLGQSVVKRFMEGGYRVTGTALANDTVSFDHPPGLFEKEVVDLLNEEEARKFVEKIIAQHNTIDAAVLTVGGFAMGNIADTSAADMLKQYQLNFETTYHIAQPVFTQMIKQNSGRIFIIGSRPGLAAWHGSGMVAYSLAKSLLVRLAELMNGEARGKNVVTSVVVPSTIDTPQNRKAMPDAPFHDWVKPEDIANVIFYHSSEEAKALRETVIKVYNNA